MSKKIPRWLPVGEHGAILKDTAGLIYGSVRRYDRVPGMWVGTALNADYDPHAFQLLTGKTADHPIGVSHFAPSLEKAMEFVTRALAERGRL